MTEPPAGDSDLSVCAQQRDGLGYCEQEHGTSQQWLCSDHPCAKVEPEHDDGCVTVQEIRTAMLRDLSCIAAPDNARELVWGDTDDTSSTSSDLSSHSQESSNTSGTGTDSSHDTTSTMMGECDENADCEHATQGTVCVDHHCVECGDSGSELGCTDPAKPVCGDQHTCVECLENAQCNGEAGVSDVCLLGASAAENLCVDCLDNTHCVESPTLPICEPQAHTCQPCGDHLIDAAKCGEKACLVWDGQPSSTQTGACMGQAAIWVGGGKDECSDSNSGAKDSPLCTLTAALGLVGSEPATIRLNATYIGSEAVVIGEGKKVAIIGASAGEPPIELSSGTADLPLKVEKGALVFMSGVKFTTFKTNAVICSEAALWLEWVQINGKSAEGGFGLQAFNCSLWANRLSIVDNDIVGLYLSGGAATVTNSVIGRNGRFNEAIAGGVRLEAAAKLHLNYATIAKNIKDDLGANLSCVDATTLVKLRNSLVLSGESSTFDDACRTGQDSAAFVAEQSVVDDDDFASGQGLKVLSGGDSAKVRNLLNDDFTLNDGETALKLIEGVVTRLESDPAFDLQGVARPPANEADYPGADQPD